LSTHNYQLHKPKQHHLLPQHRDKLSIPHHQLSINSLSLLKFIAMRPLADWLSEYGSSHRNKTNKAIHWVCVPLIVWSIILLFWSIPVPQFLADTSLNWAHVAILLAVIYYFFLSVSLAIGMLIIFWLMLLASAIFVKSVSFPVWIAGLSIFFLAWAGEFYGHKIEGKKPSFLKDVQFLLIGPLWLMHFIYKKAGIRF